MTIHTMRKLTGIPFQEARWTGGVITPTIVVLHDTASRLTKGNAANYLRANDRKVSVHFVCERDGTITQQVPVDRRANHAGRSIYHGQPGVNGFSIGIEIVNPGRMTRFSKTEAQAWYGERFDIEEYGIQEMVTPEHGHGLWMSYTEAQIEAITALLHRLFGGISTLTDVTTHWYISPGRKTDTNPLFPLDQVRSLIFGREDPVTDLVDEQARDEYSQFVQIEVPGDTLNMRRWPSFNPNIIATIPHNTAVPVIARGEFGGPSG